MVQVVDVFAADDAPPFFGIQEEPGHLGDFLVFRQFVRIVYRRRFQDDARCIGPQVEAGHIAHAGQEGPHVVIEGLAALIGHDMGDVDVAQEFRFPHHMAVAAHFHSRFGAGDDLGNRFILFDDFVHALLDDLYVVNGDGMTDFQFAVQGLAQGVFDQDFAVGIEITHGADQEENGRTDNALVAFHRIDGQPVDIAALVDLGLEADTFIIVQGGCNGHIAVLAILFADLLQRHPFLDFIGIP